MVIIQEGVCRYAPLKGSDNNLQTLVNPQELKSVWWWLHKNGRNNHRNETQGRVHEVCVLSASGIEWLRSRYCAFCLSWIREDGGAAVAFPQVCSAAAPCTGSREIPWSGGLLLKYPNQSRNNSLVISFFTALCLFPAPRSYVANFIHIKQLRRWTLCQIHSYIIYLKWTVIL